MWLLNVCSGEKATFGHGLNLQMTLTRLPKNNSSIWTQNYSTTVTVHRRGYYHTLWTKHKLSFLVNSVQNSPLDYGPKVHQQYQLCKWNSHVHWRYNEGHCMSHLWKERQSSFCDWFSCIQLWRVYWQCSWNVQWTDKDFTHILL